MNAFSHLFKPDIKKAGVALNSRSAVVIKQATDTQIEGFVKGSILAKVTFRSDSISSPSFYVNCSCPNSKKGQLCKHIWAMLNISMKAHPDFFIEKTTLEKSESSDKDTKVESLAQTEHKKRQAEYRKKSNQANKERANNLKAAREKNKLKIDTKAKSPFQEVPLEIKAALKYFEQNGFILDYPADEDQVQSAKRVLSRVFHPDKGGSSEEIIELLRNVDILLGV